MIFKMKKTKMNKRADLPTLILVLLIFMLLTVTLLSFYLAVNRQARATDDAFYLMGFNNLADSVDYSVSHLGDESYEWYGIDKTTKILEKSYENDNFRVRYSFAP
jgi:hypothetical protein